MYMTVYDGGLPPGPLLFPTVLLVDLFLEGTAFLAAFPSCLVSSDPVSVQ